MRQPILLSLAALCSAFFLIACPGDLPEDAGVADAGAGEGEGEGEGEQPRSEGETCNPTQSQCDEGLICVAGQLSANVGSCRLDCSEDETVCPANRTCQDVLDASLDFIGTVCFPQQTERDGQCPAISDPDACSGGLECLLVDNDQQSGVATSTCKQTCDFYGDGSDCPSDEACFRANYIQGFEVNPADPAALLSCTLDECDRDGDTSACECTLEEGFDCFNLDGGPACILVPGVCAIPAEVFRPDGSNVQQAICNNIDDHRVCDPAPYDAIEDGAQPFCAFQGQLQNPNDGLCVAFCFQGEYDYDDDGTIQEGEQELALNCRPDEECTFDWGFGFFHEENGERVTCSQTECPSGQLCDACPGDTMTCEEAATGGTFCIQAFGFCSPEEVDTDAGPEADAGVEDDAGDTEVDAGDTEVDAGDTEVDAGDTEVDAGDTEVDAGADAGS